MHTNIYLAEIGYLHYLRAVGAVGDFCALPPADRQGWMTAAAAIRRRVVTWSLAAADVSPVHVPLGWPTLSGTPHIPPDRTVLTADEIDALLHQDPDAGSRELSDATLVLALKARGYGVIRPPSRNGQERAAAAPVGASLAATRDTGPVAPARSTDDPRTFPGVSETQRYIECADRSCSHVGSFHDAQGHCTYQNCQCGGYRPYQPPEVQL